MALDHLHGRGLVHRDVKPENVLLFDQECRRVKLSDFGLARRAGLRVWPVPGPGDPYAAPELGGEGAGREGTLVAQAEDAWAFGVLLYGLLTGAFPWESAGPADPAYRAYARWNRAGAPAGACPPQWRPLAPPGSRMLRGLLCPWPERRVGVAEVMGYLKK
ncbi:hypothetical protein chiPu_0029894, partial [Chiloscyllium punctatum]|nr:hypothetical protein [Chiloscyllium punctatum]